MHQFETIFLDKDVEDDKIGKRRHQVFSKQSKLLVAATLMSLVIGTCYFQNIKNIASVGAGQSESRALRNAMPTTDSILIKPTTSTSAHDAPHNAVDEIAHNEDSLETPPKPAISRDTAAWPSTDLLDDLFAHDTPISQRRLVVAAANVDFVDFADNFANSLLKLNVTNFVLVPLDGEAYRILHETYPKRTVQVVPGIDSKNPVRVKGFASKEFKQLTSTRPLFLKSFLEKGYTIFYNDVDMVWRQNAWEAIDKLNKQDTTGMLWHDGGALCSCMLYLLPTPESLLLLTKWQDEIATDQHKNDQPALNKVAQDMGLSVSQKNATVQVFKNSLQFPHGKKYFGKRNEPPDETKVKDRVHAIIVHNNWIIGKQKKRDRFEEVGLWNPSGKLPETSM